MKPTLYIIKVGGAVVEDSAQLSRLLNRLCGIEGPRVLVHGGGRRATAVAAQLGIETQMVEGRRVTDAQMLEVVTMVYGGLVNKRIVAELQSRGVNAVGLTGADMDIIRAHRRPLTNGIDYGFVGDVDSADGARLASLINDGIVPVIAPLTHDGKGSLLNTNADTMAQTVATALSPFYDVRLVYCFEKPGVMTDADNPSSVIPIITPEIFNTLRADGTISGGMIPKIENALRALADGVTEVSITGIDDFFAKNGTKVVTK